jgi:hypothetical protein
VNRVVMRTHYITYFIGKFLAVIWLLTFHVTCIDNHLSGDNATGQFDLIIALNRCYQVKKTC